MFRSRKKVHIFTQPYSGRSRHLTSPIGRMFYLEITTDLDSYNIISMKMNKYYAGIFLFMVFIYAFYNREIYTEKADYGDFKLSEKALNGERLWLENNCNACHQLYGLGGYLGPDLTNVTSRPDKSDEYLKVMMISGIKSMPKFDFSPDQQDQILQFLKEVDRTGYYPTQNAVINYGGWVVYPQKVKNEK